MVSGPISADEKAGAITLGDVRTPLVEPPGARADRMKHNHSYPPLLGRVFFAEDFFTAIVIVFQSRSVISANPRR